MAVKKISYPLEPKQWVATPVKKKFIVWHGTGQRTEQSKNSIYNGRATSVIDLWNNDGEKIACPYVIDRAGEIYHAFPEHEWAYHLHIPWTKGVYDKQSIGIEVCNELGLVKDNGFYYAQNIVHHQNEYRGKIYNKTINGYDYWAELDEPQVDSLIALTLELCSTHLIEPIFYGSEYFDPKVWNKATILRHLNAKKEVYDFPLNKWVYDKIKAAGIKIV